VAELVVPVAVAGRVVAVIDLDSPLRARFDSDDAAGIEALAEAIGPAIEMANR
jgi:GAF domain-containing protein